MPRIIIYSPDMQKVLKDITVHTGSKVMRQEVDEKGNVKVVYEGNTVLRFDIHYGYGYVELITKEQVSELYPNQVTEVKRVWGGLPYYISYADDRL